MSLLNLTKLKGHARYVFLQRRYKTDPLRNVIKILDEIFHEIVNPLRVNPRKWSNTLTRKIADELFEYV